MDSANRTHTVAVGSPPLEWGSRDAITHTTTMQPTPHKGGVLKCAHHYPFAEQQHNNKITQIAHNQACTTAEFAAPAPDTPRLLSPSLCPSRHLIKQPAANSPFQTAHKPHWHPRFRGIPATLSSLARYRHASPHTVTFVKRTAQEHTIFCRTAPALSEQSAAHVFRRRVNRQRKAKRPPRDFGRESLASYYRSMRPYNVALDSVSDSVRTGGVAPSAAGSGLLRGTK